MGINKSYYWSERDQRMLRNEAEDVSDVRVSLSEYLDAEIRFPDREPPDADKLKYAISALESTYYLRDAFRKHDPKAIDEKKIEKLIKQQKKEIAMLKRRVK